MLELANSVPTNSAVRTAFNFQLLVDFIVKSNSELVLQRPLFLFITIYVRYHKVTPRNPSEWHSAVSVRRATRETLRTLLMLAFIFLEMPGTPKTSGMFSGSF